MRTNRDKIRRQYQRYSFLTFVITFFVCMFYTKYGWLMIIPALIFIFNVSYGSFYELIRDLKKDFKKIVK